MDAFYMEEFNAVNIYRTDSTPHFIHYIQLTISLNNSMDFVVFLEWLHSLRNSIIYASACFGIPSFLLYCSEVVLILCCPQFHNSFYALFLIRSFPDLAIVLAGYAWFRLPSILGDLLLPFYQLLPRWFLAFIVFILHYTFEADNLATMFILLNRLTAIAFPLRHENIWKKLLPLAVLIIYGIPLYFLYYLFEMDAKLLVIENDPYSNNRTSFAISEGENTHFLSDNSFLLFVTSIAFFIICTFINFAIFGVYRWKMRPFCLKKTTQNGQNNGLNEMERKLLAYAICTFVGHGLITLIMICSHVSFVLKSFAGLNSVAALISWTFDFGSILLPSWLLLWASSEFRKQWIAIFMPKIVQKYLEKRGIAKSTVIPPKIITAIQPFNPLQNSISQSQIRKQTATIPIH